MQSSFMVFTRTCYGLIRYNQTMSLRLRLNLLIATLLLMFMMAVGFVVFKGTKASIQEGVEAATQLLYSCLIR